MLLAVELGRQLSPSAAAACAVLPPGGTAELFDKSHFAALLPALLSSTTAHPRVHSVWKPIVKLLSEISHARAPAHAAHAAVETFWDAAGEGLFQSSHERKCAATRRPPGTLAARLTSCAHTFPQVPGF